MYVRAEYMNVLDNYMCMHVYVLRTYCTFHLKTRSVCIYICNIRMYIRTVRIYIQDACCTHLICAAMTGTVSASIPEQKCL